MPNIDGCTAARVILAFNPACKVIPMSGSVTDADKYVALASCRQSFVAVLIRMARIVLQV